MTIQDRHGGASEGYAFDFLSINIDHAGFSEGVKSIVLLLSKYSQVRAQSLKM